MGFYTSAWFHILVMRDMLAMASWPFFVIGFLPRHPSVFQSALSRQERFSCHGELWSSETWSLELLLALLLAFPSLWRNLAFSVVVVRARWWHSVKTSCHGDRFRCGELVFAPILSFLSLILLLFTLFLHNWVK